MPSVGVYTSTSRPGYSKVGLVIFNSTTGTFQRSTGTDWVNIGGGGGMEDHGNEYHTPDFADASHTHSGVYEPASSAIQTHIAGTGSPHTAAGVGAEAAGSSLGLALTAGTLYAICVGIDTVGTTAGMHCMSSTTGRIGVLPASWPGNLDIDLASPIIDPCAFFQVALSTGAMPATLPTIVAQSAWTGGMPAIFLDANNA